MYLFERLQIYNLWTVKNEWILVKVLDFGRNLLKTKAISLFLLRIWLSDRTKIC